jgi:two-component system sensor histidine kinase YesM
MNTFATNMAPITTLSKWSSSNMMIATYLASEKEHSKSIAINTYNRLNEEYLNNRSSLYINRIVVSNTQKTYLHISHANNYSALNITETISSLPYFDTLYNNRTFKWIGLVSNPFSDDKKEKVIPIIRPVYAPYGSEKIGWSYISISTDMLMNTLKDYALPQDSQLFLTIADKSYLIANNTFTETPNTYVPNASSNPLETNFVNTTTDEKGKKRTLVTVGSSLEGWYLTQSLSETQFTQQKTIYILIICLICMIVLSLGFGLTYYLNRLISLPVNKINKTIKAISTGDFSENPDIEWNNEFGDIGKGINTLSKEVIQLMDKRIESENEKKELEYQILQSQINPHFLYNTLNSIKWMATIQNATGIAEMTTALARLMKSVSKDPHQFHTIKDEIALLDNYFLIQKYRYGGALSLNYSIENEDLYDCQILKFTLQPLVENAIFHGIEPKGKQGLIEISIKQVGLDKVRLDITDNGVGMSKEQIEKTLSGNSEVNSDFFKKIGVANVLKRIQYTFGPEYGLTISSVLGEYTTMSITIPQSKGAFMI